MIKNIVRLACVMLFSSMITNNLSAVLLTRQGTIDDWHKIIELETTMYTSLMNEAKAKNSERLYMENFAPAEYMIIPAHAFPAWLKMMRCKIFEEKHVDLMVCYEEDQEKNQKFIGYCTFSVEGEHAHFDSCSYHETAVDDSSFAQALQKYLLEYYHGVRLMFAADLFPKMQDPILSQHKDRCKRLGFIPTDHPDALLHVPDEQIKLSAQGYVLNLLTP